VDAVVLRPGEGESLFNGRIVLKSSFEQLTITESHFPNARDGADPHFHRSHVDSFYVLEGGMAVLVHDEEKLLDRVACRSSAHRSRARLPHDVALGLPELHTRRTAASPTTCGAQPGDEGGFRQCRRRRAREAGSLRPRRCTGRPGEGERLEANHRVRRSRSAAGAQR
jgi:hypothetical protein